MKRLTDAQLLRAAKRGYIGPLLCVDGGLAWGRRLKSGRQVL